MTETSDGKYAAGASIISTKILMMDGCVRIREAIIAPNGQNGVTDVMSGKKDDLIWRADAIKAVADEHISGSIEVIERNYYTDPHSSTTDFEETLLSIYHKIEDIPSAEKQGEWEIEKTESVWGKGYLLTCSVCGDTFRVTENAFPYEKYCRNCGARMKGADDE